MEFFKTVLGSSSTSTTQSLHNQQSGAETVERLVERIQTSTLLEDRRDACRALKSLSRKYRVEVGAQGMDALVHVLSIDRMDSEIVAYCLDSLLNITSPTPLEDENESVKDIGHQFTEIFTKKSDNISILLALLDEYDFRIRLPLIRLLTNLLLNQAKDVQDILLVSPMGVSKLMDLLSDTREVIRNDALLLLGAVTKNNSNIQKIMAFENGFDKILNIIQEEGYSDGGPVVEDCLNLLLSLLRNNSSNQTIFREGNYIKKVLPFFQFSSTSIVPAEGEELGWPTQKVSNVYYMLQIVRTLVSPLNPAQLTSNCQKAMKTSGVLECLCNLLMASGIPIETLTENIVTVAELIRGSIENQEYFNYLVAPSEPPRPALVILLMSLVNDSQLLSLRCAIYYCVQCFLYKNESGQSEIVKTLLPTSASKPVSTITAGQLICSGLFSKDICSNWFSSICLGHTLFYNLSQKELLLKVKLATRAESPPVTLLHHILTTLNTGPKVQVKLALLQLLAIWLESCPNAITQFLSNSLSIPYLITQITTADMIDKEALVNGLCAFVMGLCYYFNPNSVEAFNKENMHQLMTNRIGVEQVTNGLNQITKSELYLQSLKHPQLNAMHSTDLIFDHSFAVLFKKYEPLILMQLNNDPAVGPPSLGPGQGSNDLAANGFKVNSRESPNTVLNQYKEFIRNQDEAIENYKREIQGLNTLNAQYKTRLEEMFAEVLQLKSQLTLVQAQRDANGIAQRQIPEYDHLRIVEEKDKRIEELQLQVLKLEGHYGNMNVKNPVQEDLINKLEEENKVLVEEVEKTKKDQEELLELLAEQDKRIFEYKVQLRSLGMELPPDDDEDGDNILKDESLPQHPVAIPTSDVVTTDEKFSTLNLNQGNLQMPFQSQSQMVQPQLEHYNHNEIQLHQQHEPPFQSHYPMESPFKSLDQQESNARLDQQQHQHHHQQPYCQPYAFQPLPQESENNFVHQSSQLYAPFQPQVFQPQPLQQENDVKYQQQQQNQPEPLRPSHEHENGILMTSHLFGNNGNMYNGAADNFLLNKLQY